MKAVAAAQGSVWPFRHQPVAIRVLIAVAGLLAVAAAFGSPPAEADANADDSFIDALNHAGVDFGQPGNAMAVGESICPMLAQPGGSFAAAVSSVRHQGMSPAMAQMFTTIAIQSYCPQAMANLASGNMPGGMPGMQGAMPNMPGGMPGMQGVMPNMPGGVMPNMPGGAIPNLPPITGPGI